MTGIAVLAIGVAILYGLKLGERENVAAPARGKTPVTAGDASREQSLAETPPQSTDSRFAEAPPAVATPAKNDREAMNRLSIVVQSSTGGIPTDLEIVVVSGKKPLFPAENGDFRPFSERFDHAKWLGNSTDVQDRQCASFELPLTGVLSLTGIASGEALTVQVLAQPDISLHEQELPALRDTEERTVRTSLAAIPNHLSGTVYDERGSPVAGAQLRASTDDLGPIGRDIMGFVETSTDPLGRYQFPALYFRQVHLEVACSRYAAHSFELELGPATSFDVVLQAGARVRVRVVDAGGLPVDAKRVWATFEDGRLTAYAKELVAGEYEFTDLPHSEVVLAFNVGGVLYERKRDALVAAVTIALPAHGRVEVTWDLPVEFDVTNTYLNLRALGQDARATVQERMSSRAGSFTFEHLMPGLYEIGIERYGRGMARTLVVGYEDVLVTADSTARIALRP